MFRTIAKYSTKAATTANPTSTVKKSALTGAVEIAEYLKQAPNRAETWSPSQRSRSEIYEGVRFAQTDITTQPQAFSAMELIHQQPVRYLSHTSVAVCNGNKGRHQGHPKVFINIDQAKPNTCGYCGLRFAKEEFKEQIEKDLLASKH